MIQYRFQLRTHSSGEAELVMTLSDLRGPSALGCLMGSTIIAAEQVVPENNPHQYLEANRHRISPGAPKLCPTTCMSFSAFTPQSQGLYGPFAILPQPNFTRILKHIIFIWILYQGKWDWTNSLRSNLNIFVTKYVSI